MITRGNKISTRHILQCVAILVVSSLLFGCDAASYVKKGNKAKALGEYYLAADYYRRAYSKTPAAEKQLRGERALLMADCYRR